jgi:lysozyme
MNLNELFKNSKKVIAEGGNVSSQSPGWQGAADQEAEEIDLKIHNRDFMVGQLQELLAAQNESFKAAYGKYIWEPKLLNSGKMFSGSSLQFFDVKGVNTQDFLTKLKKTKVGDIDTQINQDMGEEVTAWLKSIIGKKVGNGTFLGFNSSLSSIWLLDDPQVRIQVDYELGPYDAETNAPTEWFAYSHSSHYDDMAAGIKGVFHKYINRALSQAQTSTKYVARVLKKGVKISDAPVTDSDYSFAVTSAQGGGMSVKYKPYMDPATGQPMEKDGVPVMQLLEPKDRDYIQNLDQQFQINFDRKRTTADQKLQGSFVGTIQLMNKSFTTEQNEAVARSFLDILFGPGAQMITKDDPERDRDTKFAAVDAMLLGGDGNTPLKVSNGKGMRQEAVDMAMAYANAFKAKAAGKTPLAEAEVKAQLRKGMPHLRDLKPADFLDLVDELQAEGGGFKLQNIPLNVKIDGFGGRFGKNAEGKPFMGTSRTEPRYQAGFVKYHQEKGTTDPEILGRAANFDKLFNEVMAAIQMVDTKLGADFLVDKQVTCEILFLPFATQTDEGKLKFVGIEYDQLPKNVDLVLVPYRIVDASTGEDIPDGDNVVQQIAELGQSGNVMFMSNRLVQDEGLDVTEIINPLENLDELKQIVSDTAGKRDRASLDLRREVEAKLKPVQIALEKAIDEDPNIVGKDMLGQDYEGIVINSRLGPIKVTSQRQKDIISQKNAAKAAARTDRGRENSNKTAVVAIGSFVGHRGHEELLDYTIKKAKSVGGDPYLFIGNAEGKDDPIPPSVKVQTWHKLYPNLADNISTVMQGGSLLQKIKHELINPLPNKPPRYDNIIIMVGEDRATMPIAAALMKAVNKFQGYEHVKVTLEVTPRGTGMSFTKLRNILKDPNATPEQQYAVWAQGFDEAKLGKDWILHLMDITRKGMGVQQPKVQQPEPVVEQRLFNALVRPRLLREFTSNTISKIASLNNIKDINKITSGQVLKLPNGTTYKVMPGDTLSTIAARQVKDQSSSMPQPLVKQGPNPNIDQTTRDKAQAFVGQQKLSPGGGRGVVNPATVQPNKPTQTGVRSGPNTNIDQPTRDRAKLSVANISSEDDIMNMVKDHEGVRTKPYKDSLGLWTVGVGHLIGDGKTLPPEWNRTLSDVEVMNLFKKDYQHHKQAAEKIPGFSNLNMNGQAALIDLTFNMGPSWWKGWPNFTSFMQAGNIDQAANSLIKSKWYSQVGKRAPKIVSLLRSGDQSVAEQRVLNALEEGTSIESTLRAIINDIGEPITSVYDTMKFQAKKYMENHGELGRGFRMVAAGVGGRWVQNMYFGRLQNELYDLCKYNPRRTAELQDFLRGVETKGELDSKRSFGSIANGLPEILAKIGQQLNAQQLTKNAQRWIQNKAAYEQYIAKLESEADDDYDEPAQVKPPKSTAVGQQNTQVDQIVNNVLSKLPSRIQGDIRNAIARAPNKLQALQAELAKRGVKAPMAEGAPIVVAQAPIHIRNPKKAPQPYRNQGDIVPPTKPPSTEKRGVKGRPGQRPMPDQGVAEGSDIQIPTEDGITWQDIRLMAGEGKLTKKTVLQAIAVIRKQRREQGVAEERMSAAVRMQRAADRQRAKSDASLRRTPSSIPKPEPKKDEKVSEKIKGADGKACWKGYRYNGTENGKDKCVPISEDVQVIMDVLINKIIVNEAIQNNNR